MTKDIDLDALQALAEKATPGPFAHLAYLRGFSEKFVIDTDTGCWNWTAATSGRDGRKYGCFWIGRQIKAHQYALLVKQGFLSPDKVACHTCDNHRCVNPDHLYEGTVSDNVRDAVERGRHSNGQSEKTHCAKGHPYVDTNTYFAPDGHRQCRTCRDIARNRVPKAYFEPSEVRTSMTDREIMEMAANPQTILSLIARIRDLERRAGASAETAQEKGGGK